MQGKKKVTSDWICKSEVDIKKFACKKSNFTFCCKPTSTTKMCQRGNIKDYQCQFLLQMTEYKRVVISLHK